MTHRSYLDKITYAVKFKCPSCGCKEFQRPIDELLQLTFLEGYFECVNCAEEFSYYAEAFTLQSLTPTKPQLTLF
jgi:predicted RNA-binding Zn-ribbon protein involved in translation (DUF1610 family)